VLYFFCRNGDNERNNFASIARSFLSQLLPYSKDILLPYYYDKYTADTETILSTRGTIEDLLRISLQNFPNVYIVLDGIDECPRKERDIIASWFRKLIESLPQANPTQVRCLFVSQDDGIARKDFADVSTIKIRNQDNQHDIEHFCSRWASEIQRKFGLSGEKRQSIVEQIVRTADGQYSIFSQLAHGVLSHSLQKRWRVSYGRDRRRKPPTRLVVPYRAKDAPSPRSEFSHPDVIISLTCLSYYYDGLSEDETLVVLARLRRSAEGIRAYRVFLASSSADPVHVPDDFHQVTTIDLENKDRCARFIYPILCYNKPFIDYYLSEIVFAEELWEYPQRLSESPWWSLANGKKHQTTGFSRTHDGKRLLPLGIEPLDPDEQRHTDALVLSHLLRPHNQVEDIRFQNNSESG